MDGIAFWLAARTVMRIVRAFTVLFRLVRDREIVRSLPWTYIRHRIRSSPVIWVQFGGIVGGLVMIPLAVALNVGQLASVGLLAWFVAVLTQLVVDRM